jgi:catechol 2,3-dioxygenase-like lactoylglutathione lyase family enzyme
MTVVRYLVRDVDAAVAFYVDKLGFALIERWGPPFAMVGRSDLTLWLSGPGSSASRPIADGSVPAPGGWNRLVLETDDLGNLVDRVRSAGVRFRSDIVSGPGGRQILIEDPSGNPIELFEPQPLIERSSR